jgi:hypothetical protein
MCTDVTKTTTPGRNMDATELDAEKLPHTSMTRESHQSRYAMGRQSSQVSDENEDAAEIPNIMPGNTALENTTGDRLLEHPIMPEDIKVKKSHKKRSKKHHAKLQADGNEHKYSK